MSKDRSSGTAWAAALAIAPSAAVVDDVENNTAGRHRSAEDIANPNIRITSYTGRGAYTTDGITSRSASRRRKFAR